MHSAWKILNLEKKGLKSKCICESDKFVKFKEMRLGKNVCDQIDFQINLGAMTTKKVGPISKTSCLEKKAYMSKFSVAKVDLQNRKAQWEGFWHAMW